MLCARSDARSSSLSTLASIPSIEVGARRRPVEAAEDVQQGGLAGAGRSDDRHPVAGVNREVDAAQRVHGRIAAVGARDAAQLDDGRSSLRRRPRFSRGDRRCESAGLWNGLGDHCALGLRRRSARSPGRTATLRMRFPCSSCRPRSPTSRTCPWTRTLPRILTFPMSRRAGGPGRPARALGVGARAARLRCAGRSRVRRRRARGSVPGPRHHEVAGRELAAHRADLDEALGREPGRHLHVLRAAAGRCT